MIVSHIIASFMLVTVMLGGIKEGFDGIKEGVASYYGKKFQGRTTANGETFNKEALTFAHKDLPFGTMVIFYYKGNSAIARCNDRGPHIKGRHFDLSKKVADELGLVEKGVDDVEYKILVQPEERNIGEINGRFQ